LNLLRETILSLLATRQEGKGAEVVFGSGCRDFQITVARVHTENVSIVPLVLLESLGLDLVLELTVVVLADLGSVNGSGIGKLRFLIVQEFPHLVFRGRSSRA